MRWPATLSKWARPQSNIKLNERLQRNGMPTGGDRWTRGLQRWLPSLQRKWPQLSRTWSAAKLRDMTTSTPNSWKIWDQERGNGQRYFWRELSRKRTSPRAGELQKPSPSLNLEKTRKWRPAIGQYPFSQCDINCWRGSFSTAYPQQ